MKAFAGWLGHLIWALVTLALIAVVAWQAALDAYGGAWRGAPEDAPWALSPKARALLRAALAGDNAKPVVDAGVLVLSNGQLAGAGGSNQSRVVPRAPPLRAPLAWWRFERLASAAGVDDRSRLDVDYAARLNRQIKALPGAYRARLLARDDVYDRRGERRPAASRRVIDNRFVVWLARQAPAYLTAVVSIHPRRPNASARLAQRLAAGARWLRWLPAAQRIDLGSAAARRLYPILKKHGAALVLPVGARARPDGSTAWIAPADLEPALAAGVDVQLALGGARGPNGQRLMPALFRLLAKPAYRDRLTVALRGVLGPGRAQAVLAPLLAHPQYAARYRYASGYPVSAQGGHIDVAGLAHHGFIDPALVQPLRAIYDVNPLVLPLVILRNVHLPATSLGLPDAVFTTERGQK